MGIKRFCIRSFTKILENYQTMIVISHRANFENQKYPENSRNAIEYAADFGLDIEVDLRYFEGTILLGHDVGEHKIDEYFLEKYRDILWVHAKDARTAAWLNSQRDFELHWFTHDQDYATLTSRGFLWFHPLSEFQSSGISVMPETRIARHKLTLDPSSIGICSDLPFTYCKLFESLMGFSRP